jgi:hypothetical protein
VSEQYRVELDPAEVEQVLRRAGQVEAREAARPGRSQDFDASTLADIAEEVGIAPSAVAAALAERRLGVDRDPSLLDRIVGPKTVWAERSSSADAAETTQRAVDWLDRGHGRRPYTRPDGVVVAARRNDLVAKVTRSVRSVQGKGGLGKVREVRSVSVSLDPSGSGRTAESTVGVVALAADVSDKRNGALVGGSVVTATGAAVAVALAATVLPAALLALPVAGAAGVLTSRLAHRPTVRRIETEVEAALDRIVSGEPAPSLLGDLRLPGTERLRPGSGRRPPRS